MLVKKKYYYKTNGLKTSHLHNNILDQRKLHKMKVDIKWKKNSQSGLNRHGPWWRLHKKNRFSNFCSFQQLRIFPRAISNFLV